MIGIIGFLGFLICETKKLEKIETNLMVKKRFINLTNSKNQLTPHRSNILQ